MLFTRSFSNTCICLKSTRVSSCYGLEKFEDMAEQVQKQLEEFVKEKLKEMMPAPVALVSEGIQEAIGFFSRLFGGGN